MEEIEKAKQEALKKLRAIQTIDDVKGHEQEIIDTMVGFITGAVEILRAWFSDIFSLDPESKQMEIVKFQNNNFLADDEVENELDRIAEIPGAEELLDPYFGQLEEKLTPVMEETQEIMEKLMSELGGAMMGGLKEAFGEEQKEKEEEEVYIDGGRSFRDDEIQFYGITTLNEIRDKNGFDYDKDNIGFMAEESINTDLDGMRSFKSFIEVDGGTYSDYRVEIRRIEKRKDLLIKGIKTEMNRIATLPGITEEVMKVKDETLARIAPKAKEIKDMHREMKRNYLLTKRAR